MLSAHSNSEDEAICHKWRALPADLQTNSWHSKAVAPIVTGNANLSMRKIWANIAAFKLILALRLVFILISLAQLKCL